MTSRPQGSVLIADANEDLREVMRKMLQRAGYSVLAAAGGREALELAEEQSPDVAVLDIGLTDPTGLSCCRSLKAQPLSQSLMVIMLTPRGDAESRIAAYEAGADDYLEKPFHREELLGRVRACVRMKRLGDELRERNRLLIESQKALVQRETMATVGILAAGIAHEFNNILSGIAGCAQLVQRDPKHLPILMKTIASQSARAQDILQSLRTFTHGQRLTFMPVDLGAIVEAAHCLVKKEVEKKGITLVLDIPSGMPPLRGVPGQIQQVLVNLLLNAVHATQPGGTIRVEGRSEKDRIRIKVSDTGCGMSKEVLERIFDPFFTTKGPLGGGKEPGTGLGLTVVKNIIRTHGGDIAVESEPGRGSSFTITLPKAEKNEPARPGRSGFLAVSRCAPELRARLESEDPLIRFAQPGEDLNRLIQPGLYWGVLFDGDSIDPRCIPESAARLRRLDPALRIFLCTSKAPKPIPPDETIRHLFDGIIEAPLAGACKEIRRRRGRYARAEKTSRPGNSPVRSSGNDTSAPHASGGDCTA